MQSVTLELSGGILNDAGRVVIALNRNASPKAIENLQHLMQKPTVDEERRAKELNETLEVGGPHNAAALPPLRGSAIGRVIPDETIEFGTNSSKSVFGGFYESEQLFVPNTDDKKLLFSHDRPGVLSVNNIGPNTNASKYMITMGPAPNLDGHHVILGRVTHGMDVLRRVNKCRLTPQGAPRERITVKSCVMSATAANTGRDGTARRPDFQSGGVRKRDDDDEEGGDGEEDETEEQRQRRFNAQGGTVKRKRGENIVRDSTGALERVTTAIPTAGGEKFDMFESQAQAFTNNIEDITQVQKVRRAKWKATENKKKKFSSKLNKRR